VKRAELVLLPLFEAWRTRGAGDLLPAKGVQRGSLDRLFAIYRETNRYKALGRKVKRLHEQGFRLVGDHVRKSGRRFGEAMLPSIDPAAVDKLYKKLLPLREGRQPGPAAAGWIVAARHERRAALCRAPHHG
jgi:hypothetical protein